LIELDSIEILVAERLAYSGVLPTCNVEKLIKEKEKRQALQAAQEKLERELKYDYGEEDDSAGN